MTVDRDRPEDPFETIPAVVFELAHEPGTRFLAVNQEIERLVGYPREQWLADPKMWERLLHPDDAEATLEAAKETFDSGDTFMAEYRIRHRGGRWIWVMETTRPVHASDGTIERWRGIWQEIGRRKAAEHELQASEDRYRALVEKLPAVVFEDALDPEFHTLYISPQVSQVLGFTAEEFLQQPELWRTQIHEDDRTWVLQAFDESYTANRPHDIEYRMRHADGHVIWIRDRSTPLHDETGRVVGWQGVLFDVTERRRVEERQRALDRRYRMLVEQLPAIVYVDSHEVEPRSLYVSPNVGAILGRPSEQFLADPEMWQALIHPDDRERVAHAWRSVIDDGGETFHDEYRMLRPDGTSVWMQDEATLVRDARGRPTHWQGVMLDITARVEAERSRASAEARYQALVEGIPAIVYEMGPDDERRTEYVSPRVEEVLGYTRQEWLDQPDIWIELLHPEDREIELEAHDAQSWSGEPWSREYRLIAADGRVVWVHDQARLLRDPDGEPLAWQGVMFDVTAHKRAEEQLQLTNEQLEMHVLTRTVELEDATALMSQEVNQRRRAEHDLRDAEQRYRQLIEDVPAVVYLWQVRPTDDDTDLSYMSPQVAEILGYAQDEWHSWGLWRDRLHPHDRDRVTAAALRSETTGEPFELQYRYLHRDGQVVWVADRASLLRRNDAGEPLLFQGVMLDITAIKEAEAKAAEVETRYRQLAEEGPVVSYVWRRTAQGPETMFLSRFVEQITGYTAAWLMQKPRRWLDIVHPDDRGWFGEAASSALDRGVPWSYDYRVIDAAGAIRWLHDEGRVLTRDDDGTPTSFHGVILDVTEHRRAELEVREAESALRSVVEGMPAIPWTESVDAEGRSTYLFIGPQAEAVLGHTPEELQAEAYHFMRLVHPDDLDRVMAKATVSNLDGSDRWEDVYRVRGRDGSTRWFHAAAHRVTPDGVFPAIWQGVTMDVTATQEPEVLSEAAEVDVELP